MSTRTHTQEDPIGLAGGLNLYGFAGGDPINFSDPFGLCPAYAGGDGETSTAADCSREVLDAWASENVHLGSGATWDGVDSELPDAITKASIQINSEFHVSATTIGEHAENSLHYAGQAADISRVNGVKFLEMDAAARQTLGAEVGNTIMSFISQNRMGELITPGSAGRYNSVRGPLTGAQARSWINRHQSHVHIGIR